MGQKLQDNPKMKYQRINDPSEVIDEGMKDAIIDMKGANWFWRHYNELH